MEWRSHIATMFPRVLAGKLNEFLGQFPAVALLGARQVKKSTMARNLVAESGALYLDLENPADAAELSNPPDYLSRHQGRLVRLGIIDFHDPSVKNTFKVNRLSHSTP